MNLLHARFLRTKLKVMKFTYTASPALATALTDNLDQILIYLEKRLQTEIMVRGEKVMVSGDEKNVSTVVDTLKALEHIIVTMALTTDIVDALLEGVDVSKTKQFALEKKGKDKGFSISAKTRGQQEYIESIESNTITFGIGPAGTGKSFLAVAAAVEALRDGSVSRIILTRPAVEAGEKLGFLPGDIREKLDPYLRPLLDALVLFESPATINAYFEKGLIEVAPIAFMRGRTLNNAFIIADEMQNSTPEQMKMVLTRIGFNSKMVVTGDLSQSDLGNSKRSGLSSIKNIIGHVDNIGFVDLGAKDVVRAKVVKGIVDAYALFEEPMDTPKPPKVKAKESTKTVSVS